MTFDRLADVGEQHREPQRSEIDVDMRSRKTSYEVVRGEERDPLPTTETRDIDHEELGFTSAPVEGESESSEVSSDE